MPKRGGQHPIAPHLRGGVSQGRFRWVERSVINTPLVPVYEMATEVFKLVARLTPVLPAALMFCGCVHLPASSDARPLARPLPTEVTNRFARSESVTTAPKTILLSSKRLYRVLRIELNVTNHSGATGLTNVLDYYQPSDDHRPVILVLPMAGGRTYPIEGMFARYFARNGYAAVVAHRRKIAYRFEVKDVDRWFTESLQDNQRALDWIQTRPELDTNRIALFGISLGGIRGVLLTALDARIKAAALGLAGGDLAYILTHSTEPGATRQRAAFLRQSGKTIEQAEAELRAGIQCEPNRFAEQIDPRRILLVLGMFDTVVPYVKGQELRTHLGNPETLLLPTGHYTAALCIPSIEWTSLRFFNERLGLVSEQAKLDDLRSPRAASAENRPRPGPLSDGKMAALRRK